VPITPDLVRWSKPRRESTRWPEIAPSLRSFDDAVAYPLNQVVIGNLRPEDWDRRARGGSNRSTTRRPKAERRHRRRTPSTEGCSRRTGSS
jgi:hypothetical protein